MTKMLQITSFVVELLFVMHALAEFSTAHAHQGKEGLSMTRKHVVLSAQKELIDGISKMGESRNMIGLGGRKMVAHKVLIREEIAARPAGQNGEISTSSKNSGATHSSDGNCDFEGKGDLNHVKCKLGDHHHHHHKSSSNNTAKKYFKVVHHDFVAFGADYHGPIRHPPKHN